MSVLIGKQQEWKLANAPKNDKFQYTHFVHKISSFDTAPNKLLASDSHLRPDRYALEQGDLSKAGFEKSRFSVPFSVMSPKNDKFQYTHFVHKISSFDTAPNKLLASDSHLRPDRYALEQGDLSKAGFEKSRLFFMFVNSTFNVSIAIHFEKQSYYTYPQLEKECIEEEDVLKAEP
ncbi:hypothetical protein GOBAR_DD00129 [Gossypium barbadense]|nr:hypothetical protein GOBAR_DD00129 [Gossypium barbadense]